MSAVLDRVFLDVEDPFIFSPCHKALQQLFDYYTFGQNYIQALVDFRFFPCWIRKTYAMQRLHVLCLINVPWIPRAMPTLI